MKIAVLITRILMGLLFLFASITFFLKLFPQPELHGNMKIFNEGLAASIYLMPFVKIIEFLCAVAFISGRYVTLATVIIFPIILNIFCVHAFLDQQGLPISIFLILGNLLLAYNYRKNYKTLFIVK